MWVRCLRDGGKDLVSEEKALGISSKVCFVRSAVGCGQHKANVQGARLGKLKAKGVESIARLLNLLLLLVLLLG